MAGLLEEDPLPQRKNQEPARVGAEGIYERWAATVFRRLSSNKRACLRSGLLAVARLRTIMPKLFAASPAAKSSQRVTQNHSWRSSCAIGLRLLNLLPMSAA